MRYLHGTKSQILLPCPGCRAFVALEREHLTGWQEAASQVEARSTSSFACPNCGECWSEAQRCEANLHGRLAHREQHIDAAGNLQGPAPATDTLGFRWSAAHNLFLTPGDVAADEWRASRAADEDNAEREMCQFVWCVPIAPSKMDQTALEVHELASRISALPRGVVPKDAEWLTAAIDLGKYITHWIVVGWSPGATGHVVDYGRIEVASEDLGVEQALLVSLRQFRDLVREGWPVGDANGERKIADQAWVDAGYMTDVVYTFCREVGERFRPAIGRGAAQQHRQTYNRPTQKGLIVRHIGEGFHLSKMPAEKLQLVEVNADHWKSWVHQRLSTPLGANGAMTFFQASPQEHLALAKHLTAEVKTEEFVAGKGVVEKWERIRKQNHWLDTLYNASAAGHLCGVRLVDDAKKVAKERRTLQKMAEMANRPSARELAAGHR